MAPVGTRHALRIHQGVCATFRKLSNEFLRGGKQQRMVQELPRLYSSSKKGLCTFLGTGACTGLGGNIVLAWPLGKWTFFPHSLDSLIFFFWNKVSGNLGCLLSDSVPEYDLELCSTFQAGIIDVPSGLPLSKLFCFSFFFFEQDLWSILTSELPI